MFLTTFQNLQEIAQLGLPQNVSNYFEKMFSDETHSYDYFGFEGCDEMEMAIRFLVGLSPAMLQRGYVVDMSRINLAERRGPSCIASCQLCAGVAAVEVLKLALNRQGVKLAPWGRQFDAYRMRYVKTWRPGGHRNPLQRLMQFLVTQQLKTTG